MLTSRRFLLSALSQCNVYKHIHTIPQPVAKEPGVRRRKKLLQQNDEDLQQLDDSELDMESDFYNVGELHQQHEHETRTHKERLQYAIVKQKYFKQEQLPNFLTWSDKEQIRYLHRKDPETWTVEHLSDSFPALPEIVVKIINSSWRPKTNQKIVNHDRNVQKNWELFKEKKLTVSLPEDLECHLRKFSDRGVNFRPFTEEVSKSEMAQKTAAVSTQNRCTEFSEIYSSYRQLKNGNQNSSTVSAVMQEMRPEKPPLQDTYVIGGKSKKMPELTLDAYMRSYLETQSPSGEAKQDIALPTTRCNQKTAKIQENIKNEFVTKKFHATPIASHSVSLHLEDTNESVTVESSSNSGANMSDNKSKSTQVTNLTATDDATQQDCLQISNSSFQYLVTDKYIKGDHKKLAKNTQDNSKALRYPEWIKIPKEHYKPGYTYKVNDCYYDDDGEFLYRVPGFTK